MRSVPIDLNKLGKLFRAGYSVAQLAEQFACGKPAVRRNLTKLGLRMERRGAPRGSRRRATEILAEALLTTRIDRDPCTYCGTRGDIGCSHNRRAA